MVTGMIMEEENYFAELDALRIDALREIGNIGAGNAATALAAMLNIRVDMNVPEVKVLNVGELADNVGGPENQVVGIIFSLRGDFKGLMMFITEEKFAHLVLNVLMKKQFDRYEEFGEIELSALKEVANIMVSSYVMAISKMTNMKISVSPPGISVDMAGALLNVPAVEMEKYGDKALFVRNGFFNGDNRVTSYLMLIPEAGYVNKIFQGLGMGL